jgi:hypothetical protein
MTKLLSKYANVPDHAVPPVVYLARAPKMAAERDYLEHLVTSAPLTASKCRDWIHRLVKTSYEDYKPAWFEIMLYGWLREIGEVEVEPDLEGDAPDFVLHKGGQKIAIEAYTLLEYKEERIWGQRTSELMSVLQDIPKPFLIGINEYQFSGPLQVETLKQQVTRWLDAPYENTFSFQDDNGNKIDLRLATATQFTNVTVFGPGRSAMVSIEPLKRPLRKKAAQHKAIREAGYPYVIALLLEPWQLTEESVAEAWLGATQYRYNPNNPQQGELIADVKSGLYAFGGEVRHTTVSGTLAFRTIRNMQYNRADLQAWYIENPYAKVRMDPTLFPVVRSYVVLERTDRYFTMGWRHETQLK